MNAREKDFWCLAYLAALAGRKQDEYSCNQIVKTCTELADLSVVVAKTKEVLDDESC